MDTLLQSSFSWPAWPATVLVLLCCVYWLLLILGAVDLDAFDVNVDFDVDADGGSVFSLGLVPLRHLNIGRVPLMLWLTVFGLTTWMACVLLEQSPRPVESLPIAWALVRSAGIGIIATKLLTNPLRGLFDDSEPNPSASLIGRECTITTSEVTPSSGQAQVATGAAPLLLNVRTERDVLRKGAAARIVGFDPNSHLYYIQQAEPEE